MELDDHMLRGLSTGAATRPFAKLSMDQRGSTPILAGNGIVSLLGKRMLSNRLLGLVSGVFLFSVVGLSQTPLNSCDLAAPFGVVDSSDVQAAINMSLGVSQCTANIAGVNACNVVVVQRVINASLGGACVTSMGIHSVSLTWTASTSPGVTGYKVFRATTSAGPFTLLATIGSAITYMDNSVQSGNTYYYAVAAVDGSGNTSPNSTPVSAVVPVP